MDIGLCYFDLFSKPKEIMRGVGYEYLGELQVAVDKQVMVYEHSCLAAGIEDLLKCWTCVIDHKRSYFEGL